MLGMASRLSRGKNKGRESCDASHNRKIRVQYACRAGMNLLSKAVTVLLLVVFGALPMLGAAACKADTKSAMCCIPGCSMVEMEKTGAQAEIGSVGSGSSCCKAVPDMPLSMFTPISSHLLTEVMLVGTTTAHNYPHMTLRVAEANKPSNRSLHGRSQSILCNFRI